MTSVLKCCFNKNVLIGVGAVAVAVLVISPGLALRALPLLIVAACPLSMVLMMKAMRGGAQCHAAGGDPGVDERAAEIAWLREEVGVLRARQLAHRSDPGALQDPGGEPPPAPKNTPRTRARAGSQER